MALLCLASLGLREPRAAKANSSGAAGRTPSLRRSLARGAAQPEGAEPFPAPRARPWPRRLYWRGKLGSSERCVLKLRAFLSSERYACLAVRCDACKFREACRRCGEPGLKHRPERRRSLLLTACRLSSGRAAVHPKCCVFLPESLRVDTARSTEPLLSGV